MDDSIFRSYDIRGKYPQELDKETAFKLGQAFVEKTGAKQVVVGRDARISSPDLFSSLSSGIASRAADVYNIGEVPTEVLYFSLAFYKYDAGIMITASHNPKEYNGFKMVKRRDDMAEVVRGEEMKEFFKKDISEDPERGEIKELNAWDNFLPHIFSFVDVDKINPLKIVIDASCGMAGKALPQILDSLPVESINLNFKPDGSFPAHSPNPAEEESQKMAREAVIREKADIGFVFDGDGDRVFILDEKGDFKRGDITLLLLSELLLKKNKGGIAYNVMSSRAVPQFVEKWGGKPIRTKVGFVNVRKGMIEEGGIMGGEVSGHYSFKDNFYFDSGLITFLLLLQIASKGKISEMTSRFEIYPRFPEINFEVADKEKVLERIKNKFSDGEQDFLDGVTVEYENWWFNVRPSNTEPLLRLTIEAENKDLLEKKRKEITKVISG